MSDVLLEKKLLQMVSEDVGLCDLTTVFTPDREVDACIVVKEDGFVSGVYELSVLFRLFDIDYVCRVKDGSFVDEGGVVFDLRGSCRDVLVVERTALNILSRMSGVTTLTRAYVDKVSKVSSSVKVAATRKTTPLFGFFEKKAVALGGGDTHRLNLSDMVLIKDNHIKVFGGVGEAVKALKRNTSFSHKIEIEVSSLDDAVEAAGSGVDVVMLDNMSVKEVSKTIKALERRRLRDKVLVEASGGINLENVVEYAKTGVDVLSIGRLTHSATALDVSLEIVSKTKKI